MSHLHDEIHEQPKVIAQLLAEGKSNVAAIAARIREFNPQFVMIAARGTSDNAGRYAQYLLGIQAGLPVALAAPSIHTLYNSPVRLKNALVIGISQSGQSPDVRQVITDARDQGALTLSLTNFPDSPMAQEAEYHIPLMAGMEKAVAATKTYTAELTAIAILVAELVQKADMQSALVKLPLWATQTLNMTASIEEWAERYRYMEYFAVLGRGYNYCTAFEISLKIKELCYLAGAEYSDADFRHGPIAMIKPGFPVIVVMPQGQTSTLQEELLHQLQKLKAETLVISNCELEPSLVTKHMQIPAEVPEWLSPIVSILPGQVFAMNLARERGHSLDAPIGLTKVTITT